MMEFTLLTFAAMALVVVVTPGPTVLLALSNGTRFGLTRAGFGIAGAALSDAVLIAAAGMGLGSVLMTSAFLFNVVKWVGVAYLVWIGAQMLRSSGAVAPGVAGGDAAPEWARGGRLEILRRSFVLAVMNPKGLLFFAAFFPQFLDVGAPVLAQYVTLGAVFIATDVAVMAAYAGLGSKAMHYLNSRGVRWLDRLCGGVLVVMAGGLSLVRRSEV